VLIAAGAASGSDDEGLVVKRHSKKRLKQLEQDEAGYAVLPADYEEATLPELKDILRAFVTASYRELTFRCCSDSAHIS
jgi:hypothetical protein